MRECLPIKCLEAVVLAMYVLSHLCLFYYEYLLLQFRFSLLELCSVILSLSQSCTRAEYNSLWAEPTNYYIRPGRTPRDDNRDDVFNCHEVPIKEYLRKWNFVSFHLFVFAETHSHKRIVYLLCL